VGGERREVEDRDNKGFVRREDEHILCTKIEKFQRTHDAPYKSDHIDKISISMVH